MIILRKIICFLHGNAFYFIYLFLRYESPRILTVVMDINWLFRTNVYNICKPYVCSMLILINFKLGKNQTNKQKHKISTLSAQSFIITVCLYLFPTSLRLLERYKEVSEYCSSQGMFSLSRGLNQCILC